MFKFFVENPVDNFQSRWKTGGWAGDVQRDNLGVGVEKSVTPGLRWKARKFYTETGANYQQFFQVRSFPICEQVTLVESVDNWKAD